MVDVLFVKKKKKQYNMYFLVVLMFYYCGIILVCQYIYKKRKRLGFNILFGEDSLNVDNKPEIVVTLYTKQFICICLKQKKFQTYII